MPGVLLQHPGFLFENNTSLPMTDFTCSENFVATCALQEQRGATSSCLLGSGIPSIMSTASENSVISSPRTVPGIPRSLSHKHKDDGPMRAASVYPSSAAGSGSPQSVDVGTEDEAMLHDLDTVWSDSPESGIDDSCFSGCSSSIMFGSHMCNIKDSTEGKDFTIESSQSEYPSSPILVSPFSKCLNSLASEDCWTADDIYACDEFRMFEFKVRRCTRGRSHDWTECPFAHPGEKAKRRDPRKFHYSGTACPDFRKGNCRRGDACEFAHGVFECWLHPARYRTQPCKDGRNCTRRVCFFAHTQEQLRLLPAAAQAAASSVIKNVAICDLQSNQSSSSALKSYLSHGILSGKSYNEDFFDGSSRSLDILGCMRGQGSFDSIKCAGGFPRLHHVCCATSLVSSPISTLVGLPLSPPSISPPPSPSQSSALSPHSWHGPISPAISAGTACRGPLSHCAVQCPADSNIPCVQALLAATQTNAPSSIQRHINSVPTLALPNLSQKTLYRSFSSAPTSPAGIPQRNVTDLVSALQQLELRGANQIWLQQASPHASALSPLSRASNSVYSYDNGWDVDAEQEEGRVERVESGKALRAKIYGKVPEKENHVLGEDNPDLAWVNDVLE